MDTWFTSDQHYCHRNIITYCNRPFSDVDDMTEQLIERHNSVVKENDVVFNLGDLAMSDKILPDIRKRLHGKQYLVPGNHDLCHPAHKKCKNIFREEQRYNDMGFLLLPLQSNFKDFLLCHMPYVEDERHKERYSQYRPKDEGKWLLHGHIHQQWATRDRMINVGVDVWDYKPVHIDELIELRTAGS